MVLDDLGLEDVPIVLLDQTVAYEGHLSRLGSNFRRLGWQAVILIDYMKKLLLQTRPYESSKGDTDAAYQECLDRLIQTVRARGTIGDCPAFTARRFSSIGTRLERKPRIGIVGEIYVRSNPFSNNFMIRRIEALGGEAVMPTMQEWICYTDWERRRDLQRSGTLMDYLKERLTGAVQEYYVRKIRKPFEGKVRHFCREASTDEVMALSAPYLSEHVRGEANLSMGRAVEYALHGLSGIVNLMPFGCMPGTIVNALLTSFSRDYQQVPVLKMDYDGTMQAGEQTRIEAFMYQAHGQVTRER